MSKRKNLLSERLNKRALWVKRTMRVTGLDESATTQLLMTPRTQSIRLNSLRGSAAASLSQGLSLKPIKWSGREVGYSCDAETMAKVRLSNLVNDGVVYIQNAASWLPVLALDPRPGEAILDVCAAPGGKASHVQAITDNQSQLTCNDNSKPRLIKLQTTMERLGAVASYTLCDATRLSRTFSSSFAGFNPAKTEVSKRMNHLDFDRILVDAPCSGEGLMTLRPEDEKLFDSWSVAHIRRLSELQKKILHESWQLLKPGGALVYSTCTMAPEENEAVIDYFLRKHPDAILRSLDFPLENGIPALKSWNDKPFANNLSGCLRLIPGNLTEAFFVAKLTKTPPDVSIA